MKTKNTILYFLFVIVLTMPLFGQTPVKVKAKVTQKADNMTNLLGKPVYESTVDSLKTTVWILTQKSNKAMMKTSMGNMMNKMKDKAVEKEKPAKQAMITGTHSFIFDVTNIKNGKEVADTSAKVEIVSPSKKLSSVHLQPMMNYFGSGVSLDEKGEYLFTINLNVGSSYITRQFKYKTK